MTGLLLGVGFPSAATDFAAGEGRGGSSAFVLQIREDSAVNDGASRLRPGGFEVEEGLADLFSSEGDDGDGGQLAGDWGWGFGV